MAKQDCHGTKKLLRRLKLEFGDDSEYLLELAHKIKGMAATYHSRCQYKKRTSIQTYLVINQSNFTEVERSLNQAI